MEDRIDSRLVEVPIGLLKIGMYVAGVDRPCLETPFSVQGFFIESEADIDFVAAHCQHVYIDQRRIRKKVLSFDEGDGHVQRPS